MTTHIRKLRPYTYNGETRLADKSYLNMFCKDINYLFNEGLPKLLEQIPEPERYNLYYTACTIEEREAVTKAGKAYRNKRAFVHQEVIPFDIDHVCLPQIDDYPPVIAHALGVPLNELIVVYTGNGVQVIAKSAEAWTDESYFETHRQSYANLCLKIQASLNAQGLAGEVDTSVWSSGRLLRLPETENRKPMLTPHAPDVVVKRATLTKWHTLSGTGILLPKDTPLTKLESSKYTQQNNGPYLRPDATFIREQCLFMKGCLDGTIDVHEPDCYAFLGIAAFLEDDDRTAWDGLNRFSSPTIDKMDKHAKLEQARSASGPRTCEDIAGRCDLCSGCPYRGKITTPLQIRRPDFTLSLAYNGELGDKPSEIEVVAFILSRLKVPFDTSTAKVIKEDCLLLREGDDIEPLKRDYFHYNGRYWDKVSQSTLQDISALIRRAYGFKATDAKVNTTLKALLNLIPINEDQTFYHQKFDRNNFTNGTIHAVPNGDGTYHLDLRPHSKDDKLIHSLPGEYTEVPYDHSKEFGQMLDRIFCNSENKQENILSIKQMFGACILPIFPRIFFLLGVPGSGKSTILKILANMVGQQNLAHVELTNKNEFNLEDLIGKNINLITDIDETEAIKISVIKQIEDRQPVKISRKFKTSRIAPLPPINIFGANSMPPLHEKSGALIRRASITNFNFSFTEGEESMKPSERKSIKEIANIVWEKDKDNIIAFACEGLRELLTIYKGHYLNTESGCQKVREWITEKDIIKQFLNAIEDGEIEGLSIKKQDPEAMISRVSLYEEYCQWCIAENGNNINTKVMPRNAFYSSIEKKGFRKKRLNHGRFILGIKCDRESKDF